MARWTKCPKCQCEIDVTDQPSGTILSCDGCGAQIQLPRKKTGSAPSVPLKKARSTTDAPSASRGRQTTLFRKMAATKAPGAAGRPPSRSRHPAAKKNNTPLIIGGTVGGAMILGILIYLLATKNNEPDDQKKKKTPPVAEANQKEEPAPEPVAKEQKNKPPKKKPSLRKTEGGGFKAPDTFETGAETWARKNAGEEFSELEVEETLLSEFDELASDGRVSDLVKEDHKWMACILNRLLSDDERIARSAFISLRDICTKRQISTPSGKNPVEMEYFNSAQVRGGAYIMWALTWFPKQREVVASWDPSRPAEFAKIDPKEADWDRILRKLRQGGGFDDPNEPGGQVIQQLIAMGKPGWLKLASYLDHEELSLCRSVAKALNYITGQNKDLPRVNTRQALKQEWEYWIKRQPDK